VSQIFVLNTKDSLLYIDSLLPNQTYKLLATMQPYNNASEVKSNELTVTTMDTTSHNFTFESWTFGTVGSSVLYDVAIINENNIWAVGEIMIADTSQNGYTTYNAVHWNGSVWELKRIKTNACGGVVYPPIQAVFAFSLNDILFAHTDGSISHYNGIEFTNDCSLITQLNGSANKIWGISKNDFYVVSGNGFIARYNGTNWQRIASGTTLNINDIWGDFNEKTQEWEILAVSGNILHGWENEREILRINKDNKSQQLNVEGSKWPLSGLWFKSNDKYFVVGSGIYNKQRLTDTIWNNNLNNISSFHTNKIKGNNINDVIIVGAYGESLHFNGVSWKSFMLEIFLSNGTFLSVNIKNNLIIAVGYQSAQAVLTVGQR
ncbi:MAG: glucosyl transferase, partial [Ignavibacteria bacterium]|nr:glucosyl transferase [Ignavibacteria bacterium]